MGDVLMIGIAGGSGSGKTTLVKGLVDCFGETITVLSHDNYYKATTISPTMSAPGSTTTTPTPLIPI